jgi:hypothetical protein
MAKILIGMAIGFIIAIIVVAIIANSDDYDGF